MYVLEVDGAGILSAQWGAQGPQLAGQALIVHSGDDVQGLRVPVLSRPVLCGRVFGTDGRPVPGANVTAWRTAPNRGMWTSAADSDGVSDGGGIASDDFGRYRLENLSTGNYILGADISDSPTGVPSRDPSAGFWNDAADIRNATPIELLANGEPDNCSYDVRLQPIPKPYEGPRYRVEGVLGSGVSTLGSRRLQWGLSSIGTERPETSATLAFDPAKPSFVFKDVPPGRYQLTLAPPPLQVFSGPCYPFARTEVSQEIVVSADVLGIYALLRPVAWIRGKVEEVQSARDAQGWRDPGQSYWVSLRVNYLCVNRNSERDGSFVIRGLDPGTDDIGVSIPVDGAYTSRFELNGETAPDGVLHLKPGENILKVIERFDSGTVDARIEANSLDGLPERDEQVFLLDELGRRSNINPAVGNGKFKCQLPPGKYTAVAGMNEELNWSWTGSKWDDERVLKAMAALGTAFVIKPGETTALTLLDRTVEIQNMDAQLGLPIDHR